MEQYLNYEGLSLYDKLIKNFIYENNAELIEMKLTDKNVLELYYKKDGNLMELTVDLSALIGYAEWIEL